MIPSEKKDLTNLTQSMTQLGIISLSPQNSKTNQFKLRQINHVKTIINLVNPRPIANVRNGVRVRQNLMDVPWISRYERQLNRPGRSVVARVPQMGKSCTIVTHFYRATYTQCRRVHKKVVTFCRATIWRYDSGGSKVALVVRANAYTRHQQPWHQRQAPDNYLTLLLISICSLLDFVMIYECC